MNKFALLWGEAQKKIAYSYPRVTYSYPKVTHSEHNNTLHCIICHIEVTVL